MLPEPLPSISAMTRGSLVGVEPIERIVMMENHNEAYLAWKKAELRDRILVHVDAHIDFGWLPERDAVELLEARSLRELEEQAATVTLLDFSTRPTETLIDIGNYVNPALREGIVKSFYWVVPAGFLSTPEQRRVLERAFKGLARTHPRALENIAWTNGSLRAEIYGKPTTICAVADLPEFEESILLDIDTDFLVVDSISPAYPYADLPRTRPWIWPEELLAGLRGRRVRTDFVTIAYSVEGGFTPLGYKYLGDDLAALLREPAGANGHRALMALKRQATLDEAAGRLGDAAEAYARALRANPTDASTHFGLARLRYAQGAAEAARRHYREAVALDPSYRTAYKTSGQVSAALGLLARAEAEYRKALTLDPDDADAYQGLGDLAARRRDWGEAIDHYRTALSLRPGDGRTHLRLGYLYAKLKRWDAAGEELTRALASTEWAGPASYWLGYVHAKGRRWAEALEAYKAARRLGIRGLGLELALGRLYLRAGNRYKASRHYRRALGLLAGALAATLRWLGRRAWRRLRSGDAGEHG